MAEPSTVYKLIVLYLLDRMDGPLSNTQLSEFFLEKEYTNYFNVQTVLSDLVDSELLVAESTHSNTQYRLTAAGAETLRYLSEKLTEDLKRDVEQYLSDHAYPIRAENAYLADYDRTGEQDYAVHLQYKEKGRQRIDLTLLVPNKEVAEAACENWRAASDDLYAYLMELLIK